MCGHPHGPAVHCGRGLQHGAGIHQPHDAVETRIAGLLGFELQSVVISSVDRSRGWFYENNRCCAVQVKLKIDLFKV